MIMRPGGLRPIEMFTTTISAVADLHFYRMVRISLVLSALTATS
jgi:hypothetical protein